MNEVNASLQSTLQILSPPASLPGAKTVPMARGEVLEGTILSQEGPNHFWLRIKGEDLKVETQIPLPSSGKISLEVEAVTPQVILKLVSAEGTEAAALSQLKKDLGGTLPLEKIGETFSALARMSLDSLPAAIQRTLQELKALLSQYRLPLLSDPRNLEEKVFQSGLFWENRLQELIPKKGEGAFPLVRENDVKGLLMELKSQLQDPALTQGLDDKIRSQTENWIKGVDAYLQKIEAYQLLNQRYGDSLDKWMILLPFLVGQNLQFLELGLEFSRGEGGSPEKKGAALLFLLELPEIGKIRIEVTLRRDRLFCRFGLTDPSFKDSIQEHLPALGKRLEALDFVPSFAITPISMEEGKEGILLRLEENEENLVSLII